MNKIDRLELKKQGIEVLRPQFDSRKEMWKIVKHTILGGWRRYGTTWYYTKEYAQDSINRTVNNYPHLYKSDE